MVAQLKSTPRPLRLVKAEALDRVQGLRPALPKARATLADVLAKMEEQNALLRALVERMGAKAPPTRSELLSFCGPDRPAVEAVLAVMERTHGYRLADLRGLARTEGIAFARHLAVWAVRRTTGLSVSDIGLVFDRDHSLVSHAVQRIDDECSLPNEGTRELAEAFLAEVEERIR